MAVLEKIRVKLGILISVLIALALLSFIIDPTTLETALRSFSSKYDVGEINGERIGYQEYQEKIDYYTNIYTLTSGNQSKSEEVMESIRENAWQDLQNEKFILPAMKKAGLEVGVEELLDLSQGKELSPVIANEPAFRDETGSFSRAQLLQFIQSIDSDQSGNLKTYWDFLEKNMYRQQYFNKYMSLLTKSNILTPIEVRRSMEDNNITSTAQFVISPIGFQQDSSIVVSNAEIEKYYKKHIKNFQQEASRDVEFVVYEVVPSQADADLAKEKIEKVYNEFTTTKNLKNFLSRNSDTPLQSYFYKKGELESQYPEIDKFAFSAKISDVLPIFKKDDSFMAARINAVKTMSDSAFVQHILVAADNEKLADSLMGVIKKGGDFTALASQYSLDKNPNVEKPGDIGWMTQTMMIPGMEDVLTAQVNKCFKATTNYGIHIVKVSQRTKAVKKIQLAILSKEIISGKETFQNYYSQANTLASKSEGKIEQFNKIVEEENLPVIPAVNVLENAKKISKYEGVREIVRWIYDNKEGDVSSIITIDNKYFFVVAITAVREKGDVPLNTVAPSIRQRLAMEKKGEKMALEIKEKMAGLTTMEEIATALNTTVNSRNDIAFGSMGSQSFDPSLIGAIAGAKENVISGPVQGNVGVYVVNVSARETGSFYTEMDAAARANQISNYQMNLLGNIFNQMGDIQDNRAKFF